MPFPSITIVVELRITAFFCPRRVTFAFVIHAETHIISRANPVENIMYQEEGVLLFLTVLLGLN